MLKIFSTFNNSFAEISKNHKYFIIDESDQIVISDEHKKRASLKKISEVMRGILLQDPADDLLDQMKISLNHLQNNYLKKFKSTFLGRLFHSRWGVIVRIVLNIFKINKNPLEDVIAAIDLKATQYHKKMIKPEELSEDISKNKPKEELSKGTEKILVDIPKAPIIPEVDPEIQKAINELIALGGKETEAEPESGCFSFKVVKDAIRVTIKNLSKIYTFSMAWSADSSKKIELILELFNNSSFVIVDCEKLSTSKKPKLWVAFVEDVDPTTGLKICTNIRFNDGKNNLDIPFESSSSQTIIHILDAAASNLRPFTKFGFTDFGLRVPRIKKIDHVATKLDEERIRDIFNRNYPPHKSFNAWPENAGIKVLDEIITAYSKGTTKCKYSRDTPLCNELNEQFIMMLQQIFGEIDNLDKLGKDRDAIKEHCRSLTETFRSCQALRVSQITQKYMTMFSNVLPDLDQYIFDEWVKFKETLLDAFLLKHFKGSVDVHVRNTYIQALGLKYGFSPLMVEGALNDGFIQSHKPEQFIPSGMLDDFDDMLRKSLINFITTTAQYINSAEGQDQVNLLPQWAEKYQPKIPRFGFHSDLMNYNGVELEQEKNKSERDESRECFEIPHVSIYDVYKMLHSMGIIELASSLTLKLEKIVPVVNQEPEIISLGQKIPVDRVGELAWAAGSSVVFEFGEPVIVRVLSSYYEIRCIETPGDLSSEKGRQSSCTSGYIPINSGNHEIHKFKVPVQWDPSSIERLKTKGLI